MADQSNILPLSEQRSGSSAEDLAVYLSGERLYGDDFSGAEIDSWHMDERDAYQLLGEPDPSGHQYSYHALNWLHGYRYLPEGGLGRGLGFGGAFGDELIPIVHRLSSVTIIEPSRYFWHETIGGYPATYRLPLRHGMLPVESGSVDLVTCFGVLHHIPNVTAVVEDIARCIAPGGNLLLREPIVSMGDWSLPRPGLTHRERGIPLTILIGILRSAGFLILKKTLFGFRPIPVLSSAIGLSAYNLKPLTRLDALLSRALFFNLRYHATSNLHRLRPTGAYFVLTKDC